MEISPIKMAVLLLNSFLFGAVVGVVYDACRIVRVLCGEKYAQKEIFGIGELKLPIIKKSISPSNKKVGGVLGYTVIFLGDILVILFFFVGVAVLNYSYNMGEFRMFTLVGAAVGFFLYFNTLGRLVMLISEPLVMLIKYLILSFLIVFAYPFCVFGHYCGIFIKKTVFLYSFTLEKRRKKLYNINEEVYLLEMAKNGFLTEEDEFKEE